MQNLWIDEIAQKLEGDLLSLRCYAAVLLPEAVPHSSFICSVKLSSKDVFGEEKTELHLQEEEIALRLNNDRLAKLTQVNGLSLQEQEDHLNQCSLIPGPRITGLDAFCHASIPALFVDQVSSAVCLALANHATAEPLAEEIFGNRVKVAANANPGIETASSIRSLLTDKDSSQLAGILVPGVGLLSFSDEASQCYQQTIELCELATDFLSSKAKAEPSTKDSLPFDLLEIAQLRQTVSNINRQASIAISNSSPAARSFSKTESASLLGPVTDGDHENSLTTESAIQHVAWKDRGLFSFGPDKSMAERLARNARHTCEGYQLATATGGWKDSVSHLRPSPGRKGLLEGKIALVSGSAAGIGLATATTLMEAGACVIGADINPEIESIMEEIDSLGVPVDLTQESQIQALIERIIREYGGLDIVVSNAGIFTAGAYLEDMEQSNWERSMAVNLTSHQVLMKHTIPFVKKGIDPTIIFIGSRNVNAPGAGAASYSCAKAGLTQLCRVAALELAPEGVRVNIIHPDAVFDTKLWTKEALERSAERYGITVEQYKKRNLMKTEITSRSVGNTVVALASDAFAKTTGAQIPVDGGNDRII